MSFRPQADSIQGKKVADYLETGKKEGKLIFGGKRVGKKGWFIEVRSSDDERVLFSSHFDPKPTIFTSVPSNAKINKEEVRYPLRMLVVFVENIP